MWRSPEECRAVHLIRVLALGLAVIIRSDRSSLTPLRLSRLLLSVAVRIIQHIVFIVIRSFVTTFR